MARSVPQARDVAIPSSSGARCPVFRCGVQSWGDCRVGFLRNPPRNDKGRRRSALPTAPGRAPGMMSSLRSGPGGPSLGTPFDHGQRSYPVSRRFARDAVRPRAAKPPYLTALRSGRRSTTGSEAALSHGASLGTRFHHGRRSRPVSRRLLPRPPPPAAGPFLGTSFALLRRARSRPDQGLQDTDDQESARTPLKSRDVNMLHVYLRRHGIPVSTERSSRNRREVGQPSSSSSSRALAAMIFSWSWRGTSS
jgi:hypothetical protein